MPLFQNGCEKVSSKVAMFPSEQTLKWTDSQVGRVESNYKINLGEKHVLL